MSNSKVSYMGVGGIDPIAEKKRVVFRPSDDSDVVRVGDLVCYNWDIAGDYKERATNPIPCDNDTTYGAANQTYNGRLFIVEKPTEENVQFFAGVVAALGAGGGVDGDFIDIFIPNGAVVPVMIDQDTILGRTIVAVRDGVYEGSAPSNDGRPIGVAMETVTANATDALCWVKVDPGMFIWQASNADALLVDDETDAWTQVNKLQIEYAGAQWLEAFSIQLDFLAGRTAEGGIALNVDLNLYQTACATGDNSSAIQGSAYFQTGFVATGGGARALSGKVKDEATVDMSGMSIACLYLEHYLRAASTGPSHSQMIQLNATAGTNAPDYFIYAQNKESIAFTPNTTHAEDAKIGAIKIWIAGQASNPCYIWVYDGVA